MSVWWANLEPLNRAFFMAAGVFSVFFLWQLVMAVIGLSAGDADVDASTDVGGAHDSPADAADTVAAFKLVSVRSIIAFFTLFSWATALYMSQGETLVRAMLYGIGWGVAAMLIVALLLHMLLRLTASGNIDVYSTLNANAMVYLDIPQTGDGEIRLLCNGVMTHLRARNVRGAPIKAGTTVKIVKITGPNSVEVELVA